MVWRSRFPSQIRICRPSYRCTRRRAQRKKCNRLSLQNRRRLRCMPRHQRRGNHSQQRFSRMLRSNDRELPQFVMSTAGCRPTIPEAPCANATTTEILRQTRVRTLNQMQHILRRTPMVRRGPGCRRCINSLDCTIPQSHHSLPITSTPIPRQQPIWIYQNPARIRCIL